MQNLACARSAWGGGSFTWLTLPALPVTFSRYTVWMESMMTATGRICSISSRIACTRCDQYGWEGSRLVCKTGEVALPECLKVPAGPAAALIEAACGNEHEMQKVSERTRILGSGQAQRLYQSRMYRNAKPAGLTSRRVAL